jgi:hypothetical protein
MSSAEKQNTINTKTSALRSKTTQRILTGLVFAPSVILPAVFFHTDIDAAVLPQNAQEKVLHKALLESPSAVDVKVNCESTMPPGLEGRVRHLAFGVTLPYVHLSQAVCDEAESYISAKDKNNMSPAQAFSIVAVVHEGAHYTYNDPDERATACRAHQLAVPFIASLGASDRAIENFDSYNRDAYFRLGAAYVSNECTAGGIYDLDPNSAGSFPQ